MKIGVIGLGHWGSKVAKEYISLMNEGVIDSVILCDSDETKLNKFSSEKVITCNHIEEVTNKANGIHICTPNYTHYELAKKALEECVHVLVEKPMTTDHNQAYELIELASSEDLILQVGHIYRFSNVIRKIRELYENKYFGNVYYFNLMWTHLMPYIDKVDILWDLLPHPLDILNFIIKQWPKKITGVGRPYRRENLYEASILQLIFDNNIFAGVYLSWLCPIKRRILEIVGSKRTAVVECVKQEIKIFENNKEKILNIEANNTIRDEALNFINAIKTGKNNFNSSIIGARNVEFIELAVKSLK